MVSTSSGDNSNIFIVQDFAIPDILSIQPQMNFHNQSFISLSQQLTFAVLIKRIYYLLYFYA